MNAVRAALYTADLPPYYWNFALTDFVDKYNQFYHFALNASPYTQFYNVKSSDVSGLHVFGQLCHCPYKKPGPNISPCAQVVRYLHILHPKHILIETENGSTLRIRSTDFKPHDPFKDLKVTSLATFNNTDTSNYESPNYKAAHSQYHSMIFENANVAHTAAMQKHHPTPKKLRKTPPPLNKTNSRLYPGGPSWMESIDNELESLDSLRPVDWSCRAAHKKCRPIPFKVNFEYKRDTNGTFFRKEGQVYLDS